MSYALALERLKARPWQPIELDEPVPVTQLPTPALVLEAAALQRNLLRMQSFQDAHGKGIRPHAKTHKTPIIALKQMQNGAVGVCAAKVSEAAMLVFAGVSDVLVTSPVVSAGKIGVLAELAKHTRELKVVVDSEVGIDMLAAGVADESSIGVLVDVDVSMGRTGMRGAQGVVNLAQRVGEKPNLRFLGVQHYAGQIMHVQNYDERRQRSLETWAGVMPILEALQHAGCEVSIVSGGGTGTYDIDCEVPEITDLQVGSYTVMDREYQMIGASDGREFNDFEIALTIAATAISEPVPGRAMTVDGGFKAFASDTVTPAILDFAGADFRFGGDEHGILLLNKGTQQPVLGEVHRFVTPHCDPTINLHDLYWIEDEDGMIRGAWPVAARGLSW
ncbi:MAG: DSD1 family PLP-dependent enzyme [Pseudomonadales bacterium]|jgi:D-serine deaminase-like pyridoxal phosphate-dependent protein|nr:DSD1 family PLP-dependent enzyme [Pseudomonadales bacterium]MDP6472910.1 DSD1 family PLP-dependent enzyme [Pseudomonadales bacterium]MDP6826333.1 DSD1 family PLP-dependent enzyme [Pseudomonadales bacterium]MDP6973264.1 DSD1 family PLP-dependent enzyme [Pseudomonadales bacterium]|tara:strand:+ start:1256 stop:2425 length:1170 start_codon:yes stop_codon:yes gene_type:complete